jgi:hypothetical protein
MQMDSFNFFNIRAEKANAMLKNRQLQKMVNLFWVIQVCVVLVTISRLSMQLPLAVKNSTGYFRDVTVSLVNPRFLFVVGNAIIITLFAKSRQFSAQDCTKKTSGSDLYEEFINSRANSKHSISDQTHQSMAKDYRRSQSYSQISNSREKSIVSCESSAKSSNAEDEMSNEEFQRKVEAFIARQQRLLREEDCSLCIFSK